jgi:predicted HTH domain antitoxin
MTQTAVEWFQDQIIKIVNGTCELSEIQIFNQAKEMEKEQIKNAYDKGEFNQGCNNDAEQYYNETFKQQSVTDDTL